MTTAATILEIKAVKKDFSGQSVLESVSFSVKKGERHAIIGPNGAGKTTLFNVISGKYKPSSGQVTFKGEDVSGRPPHLLTRMGMGRSFQITNVFQELTVFDNVNAGVRCCHGLRYNFLKRVAKAKEISSKTLEILKLLNLSAVKDKTASTLSYGQQRALELGVTLATEPELILLDEPTAGMTREETAETIGMIDRVTANKAIVIIEHDMDVVFSLADTISVLHYGTIIASGPPDEIRNDQRVKDAYLGEE
jgi:branched-chain amino acid transport system ATP-binding protein